MFLIKGNFSNIELTPQSVIFPHASLDHYPVRIELVGLVKPSRNPFKCEKMWFLDN